MSVKHDNYKKKAIAACVDVFNYEYRRSIGIPLPDIDFILPDSNNYKSGEYYISIGKTWQIHLNFGLLPVSYSDFIEEVKVLTRHEVEHYMCCPYDVLTHFRMLNAIIETYKNFYSHLQVNIIDLAKNLANQAADIIVDTKNYEKHRDETLKSEISWIKKGGFENFSDLPRHSKLMSLLKEALWGVSLDLNESDSDLKEGVRLLVNVFLEGGISNKEYFINKTKAYTHTFFKLYQEDKETANESVQNGENSSNLSNENQDGQPQVIPAKDSQQNGSQFIFQSTDNINDALEQFAQETTLEQFIQTLTAAIGNNGLSEKEKQNIWFKAQNTDMIPISEQIPRASNNNYSYPVNWKLGDRLEDMDMMLSFATSPVMIPGVTTKKWVRNPVIDYGNDKEDADLLLVIDTSGSMGSITKPQNNLHQAVLASYGIIKYFESRNSQASLICFSDRITAEIEWTNDYDTLRDKLLMEGQGGTNFPIDKIQSIIEKTKNPIVTVVITDGELNNLQQTINYFNEYLIKGNKLFLFLQDRKALIEKYKPLSDYGAKVSKTITAAEIRNAVLNDLF